MWSARVWLVDGRGVDDAGLSAFLPWLSEGEVARYDAFVRRERQRQFVLGRVLLRRALGELLGVPARTIELTEQPGKAPRLAWPRCDSAGLSLSHSGPWVACAVSADTALGLDIEVIDSSRDLVALAGQAFGADQNAWLAARPDSCRVRDFYQLWSTQEARIKLGAEAAHTCIMQHPHFAAVLCSAQPLAGEPELRLVDLTPDPVPDAG
jgi:4'-phosphopantetheinyl transferase